MKALLRDYLSSFLYRLGVLNPAFLYRNHLFIATFHRVLPADQRLLYPLPGLAVTPEELEWFVKFFQQYFQCQRLDAAWCDHYGGVPSARPRLAITFDDGQLDNYLHAAPVLDRLGAQGTFFVPVEAISSQQLLWHDRMGYAIQQLVRKHPESKLLQQFSSDPVKLKMSPRLAIVEAKQWTAELRLAWIKDAEACVPDSAPSWDGMMSWQQIRDLALRGHEIGSHSYSHPILTQCSDRQLEKEIVESRRHIEAEIGKPVRSFCYPNGDHDSRVVDMVQRADHQLAVTTRWGSNAHKACPYTLQRHDMVAQHALDSRGHLSTARVAMRICGFAKGMN